MNREMTSKRQTLPSVVAIGEKGKDDRKQNTLVSLVYSHEGGSNYQDPAHETQLRSYVLCVLHDMNEMRTFAYKYDIYFGTNMTWNHYGLLINTGFTNAILLNKVYNNRDRKVSKLITSCLKLLKKPLSI
jgi:hypothetical protein